MLYERQLEVLCAGDLQGSVHVYKSGTELVSSFVSHMGGTDRDLMQHESDSIVALECLHKLPSAYTLLSTNEKEVKLWHVGTIPRCRRVFQGGHEFRIHSLSANSSKGQFLTCDDLTLNLWDVERTESTYQAANYKPLHMKDLREVLLHAAFHPSDRSVLLTTSTTGTVRVGDLRVRARISPAAIELRKPKDKDSPYIDVLSSITGAAFSLSGNHLYSRDFQSVFIWDLRSPVCPLAIRSVTTDLRTVLNALSSPGGIGKFEVRAVEGGCITGGYAGEVIGFGVNGAQCTMLTGTGNESLPHIVTSSSAIFTSVDNSIISLQSLPRFVP